MHTSEQSLLMAGKSVDAKVSANAEGTVDPVKLKDGTMQILKLSRSCETKSTFTRKDGWVLS